MTAGDSTPRMGEAAMGITPVLADMGATLGTDAGSAAARILLAAALGSIIGWERERHGRAAGLRTHLLLCMGCALVMLVSFKKSTKEAQVMPMQPKLMQLEPV